MRQAREWKVTSIVALAVISLVLGLACGSDDSSTATPVPPTDRSTLPPAIAEQVSSLQTQAALLRSGGEFEPALKLFQEILELQEQYLLPNHEDIATSHDDLGMLRREMGHDSQALEHFQSSLTIREAINHPDIARSVTNLANLYYSIGELDEALPLYERNLSIQDATLPAFDPKIRDLAGACQYHGAADCYQCHGRGIVGRIAGRTLIGGGRTRKGSYESDDCCGNGAEGGI